MKRIGSSTRLLVTTAALFVLAALVNPVAAQPADGQLYYVNQVQVRPDSFLEYEAGVKAYFAEFAKHKHAYPLIARVSDDFTYRYITPLENMADYERMNAAFEAVTAKIGAEKAAKLQARYQAASISSSSFFTRARPDLSYVPSSPRLGEGEAEFFLYQYWYIKRDSVAAAEQNARDFAALYKAKHPGDGFQLFQVVEGGDGPAYLSVLPAKSAQDLWEWLGKSNQAFGQAGAELWARAHKATRKFDVKHVAARPDLSYVPEQ